ncbi:MAG: TMEM43 family protein [Candidatus Riflebacteria bacterium]|nr:TMEM43 family protein [Candidatus Riflebacteria bacterium]
MSEIKKWLDRLVNLPPEGHFGLAVFLFSFMLISWNESRAVKVNQFLVENLEKVISISSEKIDPANEGKLVHITGMVSSPETIRDDEFGVLRKAMVLKRTVKMYQWDETCCETTETKYDGQKSTTVTYTYDKIWYDGLIDSRKFQDPKKYANPSYFGPPSRIMTSKAATLNAFSLRPDLQQRVVVEEPLNLEELPHVPPSAPYEVVKKLIFKTIDSLVMQILGGNFTISGYFSKPSYADLKPNLFEGGIYFGNNPKEPQIGDYQIKYTVAYPRNITLIAKQTGNGFTPFQTSTGGKIEILASGTQSANELLYRGQKKFDSSTGSLRFMGFLMMTVGIIILLNPISEAFDVFLILANLIQTDSMKTTVFVASGLSLYTIGVTWIFYRFLLVRILFYLALAVLLLFGFSKTRKTG